MFCVKLARSLDRNCTLCLARRNQGKEVHSNQRRQGGSVAFLVIFFFSSSMHYIFLVLWLLLICPLSTSATGSGETTPFVILSENILQIKISEVC